MHNRNWEEAFREVPGFHEQVNAAIKRRKIRRIIKRILFLAALAAIGYFLFS